MRIGLLSDTHQPSDQPTLWDEVYSVFKSVDLILHGGDIVLPRVLDWLSDIAPVVAARGNNDIGWDDPRMKPVQWLEVDGVKLAMTHIMRREEQRSISELRESYLGGEHADVIVTGDSHRERLDYREGVLQINSGSPTLPHHKSTRLGTVALLEIAKHKLDAKIVRLGHTEGRPNPGIEYSYSREAGVVCLG